MEKPLNVLVTAGRFLPATGIVRALHRAGARVDVADSYDLAPALHSRSTDKAHVISPPSVEPIRFVDDVAEIVRQRHIDLVVPSFEEGFYLSRYSDRVPAPVFTAPFDTLARLHDKSQFLKLCQDLNLRTPKTIIASTRDELREAARQFFYFVARPVFSRGGHVYMTNHGPRANETTVENCEPTPENPWLVQEYVEGRDACSFSVARDGKIIVHCAYEPSIPTPGGWSVQFSSIKDFGALEIASTICAELGFSGFIGFDYRRTWDGVVMIECNPRSTAGVFLSPEDRVGEALLGGSRELHVVEPGLSRQYDSYLLEPHLTGQPAHEIVRALLTTPDAMTSGIDVLPSLFCFIGRRHWSRVGKREHRDVGPALLAEISWDGSPLPPDAS